MIIALRSRWAFNEQ